MCEREERLARKSESMGLTQSVHWVMMPGLSHLSSTELTLFTGTVLDTGRKRANKASKSLLQGASTLAGTLNRRM